MKVFISSVIRGYEPYRAAAVRAAHTLGHEVIRAEDFGASPHSPQQVCLAGVRAADVVVLLLGARYGDRQSSGLSPTHEEYREARERCPVLVFVQQGVEREADQQAFLGEVESWSAGHSTKRFAATDELQESVTRAPHELELSRAVGPLDEDEMVARALALVRGPHTTGQESLCVVVTGGPRQQVLRPAELEDPRLPRKLIEAALFGGAPIFDPAKGTGSQLLGNALFVAQEQTEVLLDELGTVRIVQPARGERDRYVPEHPTLIEEEIRDRLGQALRFAGWVLDQIDALRRVSDIVVVAALLGAGWLSWRTRAEHAMSPHSGGMGGGNDRIVVHLSPPRRNRAALTNDTTRLAEDLMVLLRREVRS